MPDPDIAGYRYTESGLNESHGYLLPAVFCVLDELNLPAREQRSFEVGSGDGAVGT